jgi:predicted AlkP superfamily pyrophosphatase or phosphodiesterase
MKSGLLALAFVTAFQLVPPVLQAATPAADRLVVLISVDGLAHYYFDDPKAPMPTIRKLAAEGARAKWMRCSFPTVTWTNHTTLVTGVNPGKHGVIGNDYFDRDQLKAVPFIPDPIFNKEEIVNTPTIYDLAHDAGLKTGGICWPASRGAKTWNWTVPDVFDQATFEKYSTPELLADAKEVGIPYEKQMEWCQKINEGKPMRDSMYARLATLIIAKHKPNLICLHLMTVDSAEHSYGHHTPEAYWAIHDSDSRVRDVVDAVEAAGMKDKTTFVVTSDHGFINFTKLVQPNVMLKKAGLVTAALGNKITDRKVWCHAEGGACFVYVLDEPNRDALISQIKPKLVAMEGVAHLIEGKDFPGIGFQTPDKDRRLPDLVLSAKDGYMFSSDAGGDAEIVTNEVSKGAHGYLQTESQMGASFVISGYGIKKGVVLDEITNLDVAPTMASLLGVQFKDTDGRVLREVLK